MPGLFLRATPSTCASGESHEFAVELDPAEPFLDDHRPGGHPLFGTVMGLELMARSVAEVTGCSPSALIQVAQVVVSDPIIVTEGSTTAYVRVTRTIAESGETFQCAVTTRNAAEAVTHFRAILGFAEPMFRPHTTNDPTLQSSLPVQASDVYALFFHGPTFRVIRRAGLLHNAVVAEVATRLPDLTSDPHDNCVLAPRLIEACLQTAGLLEIATESRMMIPSRIGSIEFFGDRTSAPAGLFTLARRSIAFPAAQAIEIDVVDLDGACWLRVSGYETLPLPFPSDLAAIGDLSEAFRRTTTAGT